MKKNHILLIENRETEIEFFTEALEESGLTFLCNTARNIEQAFKILKNVVPDLIFIDTNLAYSDGFVALKKIKSMQKTPVILYSTIQNKKIQQPAKNDECLNYVQLPGSIQALARILKNLFIDNEINQPIVMQ